ncbi:MAG: YggT family protein [Rugosibacter sp.]|nr:YggT family protein [Rugosibacter sp.]
MLMQLLMFLVDTLAGFFTLALLIRFILQWVKAPFRNPLGQFVIAVTDWAVRPTRRLIPGLFGLDMASLVLAWFTQLLMSVVSVGFSAGVTHLFEMVGTVSPAPILMLMILAVILVAKLACYVMLGAVLMSALFSWVNPNAPLADVVNAVSYPLLKPLRRWIPLLGGVDMSPLAFVVLLQMLMMVLERLRWAVIAG